MSDDKNVKKDNIQKIKKLKNDKSYQEYDCKNFCDQELAGGFSDFSNSDSEI